jgi:hypothetical protein
MGLSQHFSCELAASCGRNKFTLFVPRAFDLHQIQRLPRAMTNFGVLANLTLGDPLSAVIGFISSACTTSKLALCQLIQRHFRVLVRAAFIRRFVRARSAWDAAVAYQSFDHRII